MSEDLVAKYGDPIEKIADIHDELQRRLTAAKLAGDEQAVKHLREQLQQTHKVMLNYGLEE